MFFPILNYDDGYGWTYGARTTASSISLGKGTHVVGAAVVGRRRRRAAVEVDRTFHVGPAHARSPDRSASRSARTRTTRSTIAAPRSRRARERRLFDVAHARRRGRRGRDVTFAPSHDRFWSAGADVDARHAPRPVVSVRRRLRRRRLVTRLNAIGTTRGALVSRRRSIATGSTRAATSGCSARTSSPSARSTTRRRRPLPHYEQLLLGGSLAARARRRRVCRRHAAASGRVELRAPFIVAAQHRPHRLQRLHRRRLASRPTASASPTSTHVSRRRRRPVPDRRDHPTELRRRALARRPGHAISLRDRLQLLTLVEAHRLGMPHARTRNAPGCRMLNRCDG